MERYRKYDMLLLLSPDLDNDQVEKLTDKFAQAVEKNDGKLVKRSNWGRRQLAYEVNRQDKGIYYLFHIEATADCVTELTRLLKIDQDVMKSLITRVEKFTDPFGRVVEEPEAAKPEAAPETENSEAATSSTTEE